MTELDELTAVVTEGLEKALFCQWKQYDLDGESVPPKCSVCDGYGTYKLPETNIPEQCTFRPKTIQITPAYQR